MYFLGWISVTAESWFAKYGSSKWLFNFRATHWRLWGLYVSIPPIAYCSYHEMLSWNTAAGGWLTLMPWLAKYCLASCFHFMFLFPIFFHCYVSTRRKTTLKFRFMIVKKSRLLLNVACTHSLIMSLRHCILRSSKIDWHDKKLGKKTCYYAWTVCLTYKSFLAYSRRIGDFTKPEENNPCFALLEDTV